MKYDHVKNDKKWQKKWVNEAQNTPDIDKDNKPFYNLWMFPYPSGEGLHAGHAFASTGSDVYGRYQRMNQMDVFQPIGYDSFGIHSENYAIKINEHPETMLKRTIDNISRQMKHLGHAYDWTRTVTTSDIEYYRWTQWLFVQMFKAGLAYRKAASVNWCSSCKTVLADEQVIDEECERCGTKVELRKLEQWFFRITDYADKLLSNLDKIDWSGRVVSAQRNWIGKKEGINIEYEVDGSKEKVVCWTSRPDTNFGATFIILAPEHPLVIKLATKEHSTAVTNYIELARNKSDIERVEDGREKTGVFTGSFAINHLTGKKMPIWVSDFVIAGVGTGAVVGVPGHDMRDFEFANKFDLEIIRVVLGQDGDKSAITSPKQVQENEGKMVNSDFLDGMDIKSATAKMMDYMVGKGWGKRENNYHLRDWLISRQRYWGPPIPMVYCELCAKAGDGYLSGTKDNLLHQAQDDWEHAGWYPEENLPVELPHLTDYKPKGTGRGPLEDHPEFYKAKCPGCGAEAKRETDVSDTFLDSAWYFLRYPSVDAGSSNKLAIDPTRIKKWLPVNLYFGGAEHSVLHLMYSRFATMVLNDLGYIDFDEPFPKFFAHGMMIKDGAKMSKSRGNVVNPDKYVEKYGADTLRLYLLFMGPMDGTPDFRDTGIEGMRRFVDRVWELIVNQSETKTKPKSIDGVEVDIKMHHTIQKVTEDIKNFRYNTAISAIMEYVNLLRGSGISPSDENINILIQLIAPFTPHMAEEAWSMLGESGSVHSSNWPKHDPKLIKEETVEIPIQINGKLRASISVSADISKDETKVVDLAKEEQSIAKWIKGKQIKKTIFVPGKLVNFVV